MTMAYADALKLPQRTVDTWIVPNSEGMKERFDGMELERVREMLKTDDGRTQLLLMMKESDPTLEEHVDRILPLIERNVEQLKKKESFLMKMAKLPVRAAKAVGRMIAKHPILSAIGAAGIVALLVYFFTPMGATVGEFGRRAIDAFGEKVLGTLPVPHPVASMEAAATTPVVGGLAGPNALVEAVKTSESAGGLMMENLEAVKKAGLSDQLMRSISDMSKKVLDNPHLENLNPVEELFRSTPPPPQ